MLVLKIKSGPESWRFVGDVLAVTTNVIDKGDIVLDEDSCIFLDDSQDKAVECSCIIGTKSDNMYSVAFDTEAFLCSGNDGVTVQKIDVGGCYG